MEDTVEVCVTSIRIAQNMIRLMPRNGGETTITKGSATTVVKLGPTIIIIIIIIIAQITTNTATEVVIIWNFIIIKTIIITIRES